MSYLMVHLTVAQRLLERCPHIRDLSAFYKGSLAPDAIMFRPGCQRSDKSVTHFCTGDEGWGYYTNYDDWTASLFANMPKYAGNTNEDFLFGYCGHILTDIACTRRYWTPIRLTGDEKHIQSYLQDCYEVDSLLMEGLENKDRVWSLLADLNNHCLQGLFDAEDTSLLMEKVLTDLYDNRYSNPNHAFSVVDLNDILSFTEETADEIVQILKL